MDDKIEILGVEIDNLTIGQAVLKIDQMVKSSSCHQIATVNPEFLVEASRDKKFKRILNQASLAIPDGIGLLWAAKRQKENFLERIAGADLVMQILKKQRYSFYFLGGAPGVAKRAANKLLEKYPRLKILGATDGGLITDSNLAHQKQLIYEINKTKPDILLVALGAPKQDKFIARWQKDLKCRVAIGVGGTFDYIAGTIPRAPRALQKIGLEWLWRFIREPRRFKRIFNAVIIFPYFVLTKK
mgnify:FL=1